MGPEHYAVPRRGAVPQARGCSARFFTNSAAPPMRREVTLWRHDAPSLRHETAQHEAGEWCAWARDVKERPPPITPKVNSGTAPSSCITSPITCTSGTNDVCVPACAAEGDEQISAAVVAMVSQKAVGEDAAGEVVAKRLLDVARQTAGSCKDSSSPRRLRCSRRRCRSGHGGPHPRDLWLREARSCPTASWGRATERGWIILHGADPRRPQSTRHHVCRPAHVTPEGLISRPIAVRLLLFGLKSGDAVIESFDRLIVDGISLHSVIGRRIFETWHITRYLLESRDPNIHDLIWEVILNRGEGRSSSLTSTIRGFSEGDLDLSQGRDSVLRRRGGAGHLANGGVPFVALLLFPLPLSLLEVVTSPARPRCRCRQSAPSSPLPLSIQAQWRLRSPTQTPHEIGCSWSAQLDSLLHERRRVKIVCASRPSLGPTRLK